MTSDLLPEIEDALDTWQEGLSQFMYGPAERQRLTAILRAKLFAVTRPAPALSEIVAAAEEWVEAEKTCDEYCFHSVAQRAYARARFLALVAAHAAEVAKVMEPFAELAALLFDNEGDDTLIWGRTSDGEAAIRLKHVRAAADLRRRVTAATHEKKEG